jgi:hypothetical protein
MLPGGFYEARHGNIQRFHLIEWFVRVLNRQKSRVTALMAFSAFFASLAFFARFFSGPSA